MPTAALHQELADELWEADRAAKPVPPLTDRHTDLTIEDAYAIQTINIDRRIAAGQRVIDHGGFRNHRHTHLGRVTDDVEIDRTTG